MRPTDSEEDWITQVSSHPYIPRLEWLDFRSNHLFTGIYTGTFTIAGTGIRSGTKAPNKRITPDLTAQPPQRAANSFVAVRRHALCGAAIFSFACLNATDSTHYMLKACQK